jgi:hypothetical protein
LSLEGGDLALRIGYLAIFRSNQKYFWGFFVFFLKKNHGTSVLAGLPKALILPPSSNQQQFF